jgi:hypothetical protein
LLQALVGGGILKEVIEESGEGNSYSITTSYNISNRDGKDVVYRHFVRRGLVDI